MKTIGGIDMIDSPVSGSFPGAQGGTLTMMAAGGDAVLKHCRPVMAAVGRDIYKVGEEIGMGQTVKACPRSIMGSIITATTEAGAFAAKAGVDGEAFHQALRGCVRSSVFASGGYDDLWNVCVDRHGDNGLSIGFECGAMGFDRAPYSTFEAWGTSSANRHVRRRRCHLLAAPYGLPVTIFAD